MKKLVILMITLFVFFGATACSKNNNDVLVVGYSEFSENFSPFFATSQNDSDVASMTGINLLTIDRDGGIIYNSIQGETVDYNGIDYLYKGISDIEVTINGTGDEIETLYDISIRDDVKFSDGEFLTADDIIFSYYALLDPYYDGNRTLNSVNIKGYMNYSHNSSGFEDVNDDVIQALLDDPTESLSDFIQEQTYGMLELEYIGIAGIIENGLYQQYWYLEDGTPWSEGETASPEGTLAVFYSSPYINVVGMTKEQTIQAIVDQYGDDYKALEANVGLDSISEPIWEEATRLAVLDVPNDPVYNISGIEKVSNTNVLVTVKGFDAAAIHKICGITVAPMHYYGDASLYNYENNEFGFENREETSMDLIKTKSGLPMGAGPYEFVEFSENVVYFKANKNYYKGTPKIENILFQVVTPGSEISSIEIGNIDVANLSASKTLYEEIEAKSDIITMNTVDNSGYGYVGLNARKINIDGDINSDESIALRTGLATVLSAQRYISVNSYYGVAASIIDYPITSTSWATPDKDSEGYEYAFSKNPDGSYIYGEEKTDPSTLSQSVRSYKAKEAAKLWLEAAGYTFVQNGITYNATAPIGGETTFSIKISRTAAGHPSSLMCTFFKSVMAELGITINIENITNPSTLYQSMYASTQEMWCSAWGQSIDPDLFQVYHSSNTFDAGANSTGSNFYYLKSNELDQLIIDARNSADQDYREEKYKEAFELIMSYGVSVPVYQRQDCTIFSNDRVNLDTLPNDITTYWGWMSDIENLKMK